MPQHKSAKKRLKTAEKANMRNRMARSTIRTSWKKIQNAENKAEIMQEMPRLFSLVDKARKKNRAEITPNLAGKYKRKVHKLLASTTG